jgi:hypothetical protein
MDDGAAAHRVVREGAIEANARDLEGELAWFARVVDARFKLYFGLEGADALDDGVYIPPPDLSASASAYARLVRELDLDFAGRLALVLALVPHLRPRLLDVFHTRNATFDRRFTEFGGAIHPSDGSFLPTPETLSFILGGGDLAVLFALQSLFDPRHVFARRDVLRALPSAADEPPMKSPLRIADDVLSLVTTGAARRPGFGAHFPAQHIETALSWDDLVLHPATRARIAEIEAWTRHRETLMRDWGMAAKLRPGYRSLFYGPPGTGKTMTACLLGKATGHDVFRIDLSLVVSKYIGETEKNLARVFDQAQAKDWILFFDEADALFGKRTESRDAHDRYANQEVSFLLQRIETFDGIAILASNLRDNIDDAFARRFESIIYFPMPGPEERLRLWRQGFSPRACLEETLDLAEIAREHALSGGAIMNAIRFASLQSLREGGRPMGHRDLVQAVRRELAKEGRVA